MAYNITNVTNIQNFYDLTSFAATSTQGLFWGIILVAFFTILVVNLSRHGIGRSTAAAGYACLIPSILLMNLGYIQILYPVIFGIIAAGATFYIIFTDQ